MNHKVLRMSSVAARGTMYTGDMAAPKPQRFQRSSHYSAQEQWNRELNVRLQERLREPEPTAHELNDALFQGLVGASMQLHNAVEQMPTDSPHKSSVGRVLSLMQRVIEEGRATLQRLSSSRSASRSLEGTLSGLRDEFSPRHGLQFRVFISGKSKALRPDVQEQLYLIAREALFNALRHSDASSIEVEVEYLPRQLRLVVSDNGCGIDPQVVQPGRGAHWGLLGMRERAGNIGAELRVLSRPGAGTEVTISIPCDAVLEEYRHRRGDRILA
jgi:signal transduction histidine kinase